MSFDNLSSGCRGHAEDSTAFAIEVAHNIAHVFIWNSNFHVYNRLHNERITCLHSLLVRHRSRDLKRHFRRVNRVEAAIIEGDFHVHHLRTCQNAFSHGLYESLFHSRDVLSGNRAAHYSVNKLKSGAALLWFHSYMDITILTTSTCLFFISSLLLRG